MQAFRIIREGDDASQEIRQLLEEKPTFLKKGSVCFVGCYTTKDGICVYSLPKYCPDEWLEPENFDRAREHITLVCRVIEYLRACGKNFDEENHLFDPISVRDDRKPVDRLSLAEFILKDYLHNGLFTQRMTEQKINADGRPLWGSTISRTTPVIERNRVIYPDIVAMYSYEDPNDRISVIHANIINQCIGLADGLFDFQIEPVEVNAYIGNKEIYEYKSYIDSRITTVFDERSVTLLKALSAWCGDTRNYKDYLGVTSFDRVWEYVNDMVWGNVDVDMKKSGNPTYEIGDNSYSASGEGIPDTIRMFRYEDKPHIAILDSKYYVIKGTSEKNIYGLPSNADIVKQISYGRFIAEEFCSSEISYANAFLLPFNDRVKKFRPNPDSDGELFAEHLGRGKRGDYSDTLSEAAGRLLGISPKSNSNKEDMYIDLVFVEPEALYDRLLSGKTAEDKLVADLLNFGKYQNKADDLQNNTT